MAKKQEREISTVKVLPLYGMEHLFDSIEKAIEFIKQHPVNSPKSGSPLVRYGIDVRSENRKRTT